MFVVAPEEVADVVGDLGFDLIAEPVSWTAFGERLLRRNGKLKSILMDPTFLVGIGPMYSDEILFEAGLRYDRDPKSLSTQEIRRLYRSTVEIDPRRAQVQRLVARRRRLRRHLRQAGRLPERDRRLPARGRDEPTGPRTRREDEIRARGRPTTANRPRCDRRAGGGVFLKTLQIKGFKSFADGVDPRARTGRDRGGRPERVGQVQRGRRHRVGARRPGALRGSLPEDGRRDLRRLGEAARARPGRGVAHHRQLVAASCRSTSPRSRSPVPSTARATPSTRSTACRAGCSTSRSSCRDSGVGRQQHVIISQGQIDAVLNAKPEDRRLIIEEAAGVLKFRRRKEKAERRLARHRGQPHPHPGPAPRGPSPAAAARASGRRRAPPRPGRRPSCWRCASTSPAASSPASAPSRPSRPRPSRNCGARIASCARSSPQLDAEVLDVEGQLSGLGGPDVGDALVRYESLP